jgi:hypothetical protein
MYSAGTLANQLTDEANGAEIALNAQETIPKTVIGATAGSTKTLASSEYVGMPPCNCRRNGVHQICAAKLTETMAASGLPIEAFNLE